jgi:pimeloyl-ACP methyl ester carboxylesterase
VLLKPEAGIELPVTFLSAGEVPAASILHFDDKHRNRLLHRNGLMGRSINFINEADTAYNLLSVDLRGWGDTETAMYPFELAGWGSIDRYLAYASAALGDPLMSMRIRDGLASLAYLRSRSEVDSDGIVITGCGLGGIVALHVAAIDTRIKGVLVWDTLYSFMSLLEIEDYTWPHDTFVPNVLLQYDLPELISALTVPVSVLNPLDGRGKSLPVEVIKALNIKPEPLVYCPSSKDDAIVEAVGTLLNR